ncbi:MAG: AAA family ATPase [Nitrospinaceae bacterium]
MITDLKQRDYYQVLGVCADAAQPEIDSAYQRLISRFDSPWVLKTSAKDPTLEEQIALVQEAYDTLSSPDKREAYDALLKDAHGNPVSSPAQVAREVKLNLTNKGSADLKRKRHQNIYKDFFGFSEKPFDLTPDPKYLYLSPKHKEVLAHLVYGLQENNGFLKIVGEVGTGKTTICRSFLRELRTDFSIAYVFNPCIDELELLQTINAELGLPSEIESRKKLIDILNTFLLEERQKGHRVVVIIDEAQDLEPAVLEQLRLLSNLETETEKLIQIVLIGQPELDTLLTQDGLRQLRQRITISWELLALNLEETRGYIQHRLNVALGKGKVKFMRPAVDLIYGYAHGIPRMINVLADRSLLIAYTMNTKKITPRIVRLAVKDVGGLTMATSWNDTIWKTLVPALAGLGLLLFTVSHMVLPDLTSDVEKGKDLNALMHENPIDISDPGKLVPRKTPEPSRLAQAVESVPAKNSPPPEEAEAPRRIPSVGPLIISQPEKLVTYLASLSLSESRDEAVRWALEGWGIPQDGFGGQEEQIFETLKETHALRRYEMNANFKKLARFNYPAILEIALPNAQGTKYLALISIEGDQGVFGSVDKIKMPLGALDSLWTRKAILLWKDFENLPVQFEKGFRGKESIWLQKNLRLLGFFQGREAPVYGPKTVNAVLKFQRGNGIRDDGRFGVESKLMIYNLLSIYRTPRLIEP